MELAFFVLLAVTGSVCYAVGRTQGADAERQRVFTIFGRALNIARSRTLSVVHGAVRRDYDPDDMARLLQDLRPPEPPPRVA